jgi:hypothetical protein
LTFLGILFLGSSGGNCGFDDRCCIEDDAEDPGGLVCVVRQLCPDTLVAAVDARLLRLELLNLVNAEEDPAELVAIELRQLLLAAEEEITELALLVRAP